MSDNNKTMMYVAAAIVLAILALIAAPRKITPEAFVDQGEAFFPDFTDPNQATTLEVIDYDESQATAIPFKVTFKNGIWTIPSHHDYPADAKDRLARTAAGVIDIRKQDFRTDNVSDHAALGVIDPLAETGELAGRGQRITLRDAGDQVLFDLIVGKEVEGRPDFRFVRVPATSRVYTAKLDVDISTRFEDWIQTDLLDVLKPRIRRLVIDDYSIDERSGRVNRRDKVTLDKEGDRWVIDRTPSGKKLDTAKVEELLKTVDELKIVGVRPKPAGLSATLKKNEGGAELTQGDLLSLQSKGYFFDRDGRLLSNEGELQVLTKTGVKYVLRFGEVVYGQGDAVTAGVQDTSSAGSGAGENRYLFVLCEYDPSISPEPPLPADTSYKSKPDSLWTDADRANNLAQDAHRRWVLDLQNGRETVDRLNARFSDWYYVISQDSYEKLRLTRNDLMASK